MIEEHHYTDEDLDAWEDAENWLGTVGMHAKIRLYKNPNDIPPEKPRDMTKRPASVQPASSERKRLTDELAKHSGREFDVNQDRWRVTSSGLLTPQGAIPLGEIPNERLKGLLRILST